MSPFRFSERKESCVSALLELSMDLFKKMVNVKEHFHLTLLNVCFAKFNDLQRPTRTSSITAFMQSRCGDAAAANSNKSLLTTSAPTDSPDHSSHFKRFLTIPKTTSTDSDSLEIKSACAARRSPEHLKRPRIERLDSVPRNSDNSLADHGVCKKLRQEERKLSGGAILLPRNTSVLKVSPNKESTGSTASNWCSVETSGHRDANEATFGESLTDEYCTERIGSICANPKADSGQLKGVSVPPDVDQAVFHQLPSDIQQELIKNWRSKQDFAFSLGKTSHSKTQKQSILKYLKKK